MTAQRAFTHPLGIILGASLTMFLWGSAFPFIKLSYTLLDVGKSEIFEQIVFAGYRFVLAGILILAIMLFLRKDIRYQAGTFLPLVKVGLFQTFCQYILFYVGLSNSTGIQGSIIAGTTSFFQILLAHFMYKNDSLSIRKIIGLTIGFLGVILVNLPKGTLQLHLGLGEILLLLAMFSGALGNVFAKNVSAKMDILYMTAYQMLIGGMGLICVGAIQAGVYPFAFSAQSFFMLLYLAFASAAGFLLWNNIMKFNKVGKVSMYLFLIPVFGVALSAGILGEEMHLVVLLALALVVSGIIIVNREQKQHTKASEHERSA
jgi:drug/metabolite transporter (DMT)-like permease